MSLFSRFRSAAKPAEPFTAETPQRPQFRLALLRSQQRANSDAIAEAMARDRSKLPALYEAQKRVLCEIMKVEALTWPGAGNE